MGSLCPIILLCFTFGDVTRGAKPWLSQSSLFLCPGCGSCLAPISVKPQWEWALSMKALGVHCKGQHFRESHKHPAHEGLGLTLYFADVDKKMKIFLLHGLCQGTGSLASSTGVQKKPGKEAAGTHTGSLGHSWVSGLLKKELHISAPSLPGWSSRNLAFSLPW